MQNHLNWWKNSIRAARRPAFQGNTLVRTCGRAFRVPLRGTLNIIARSLAQALGEEVPPPLTTPPGQGLALDTGGSLAPPRKPPLNTNKVKSPKGDEPCLLWGVGLQPPWGGVGGAYCEILSYSITGSWFYNLRFYFNCLRCEAPKISSVKIKATSNIRALTYEVLL